MKNLLTEGLLKPDGSARRTAPINYNSIKNRAPLRGAFQEKSSNLLAFSAGLYARNAFSNRLLGNMPPETVARLARDLEPVSLSAGENLHKPGERVRYIYFPERAVVSHLYMLADGNTSEVAMVGGDGIVGLSAVFSSDSPQFWTEVTVPGEAFRIKTEILREEFAADEFLRKLILDYAAAQISQISQRTVCNTHHVAEARLCSWLLMLHDRVKSSRLSLTQDKIARYLGVNRPSITHIAQLLREKGLIAYTRGFISILDRPSLEKAACECYESNNVDSALYRLV